MDSFRVLLDQFTTSVETKDIARFTKLFVADGEYEDVFYGLFRGREAIGEMLREHFYGNAKDFRWEMHDEVCDGDVGYAHYTFSYTSTMKHSAGTRAVFTGCSQFRLSSGSISHYREWAFGLAGLSQLASPPELIAKQAIRESERIRANADRVLHGI
mgnify:CR=1 FL=1